MGFSLYDKANLAILGYAFFNGDGSIGAGSNLRVMSHTPGSGFYYIQAPLEPGGVQERPFSNKDISLVTVMYAPQALVTVTNATDWLKALWIRHSPEGSPMDAPFSIVILRPLLLPP
jgi:hypothetical protein